MQSHQLTLISIKITLLFVFLSPAELAVRLAHTAVSGGVPPGCYDCQVDIEEEDECEESGRIAAAQDNLPNDYV